MKKKLLHECLRVSLETLEKHPQKDFKHWSFIIQENKVVEWGVNMNGVPPVHFGYHSQLECPDGHPPKSHAEFVAWRKARGLLNGEPFECVNVRLNRRGETRISKPCECCYNFLKSLGCSNFWFTTEYGWSKIIPFT